MHRFHRNRTLWLCAALLTLSASTTLQAPTSFSIVLLPDTQNYTEVDPATYYAQADSIVRWRDSARIKFVLHLGDLTDSNLEKPEQWDIADSAHRILENARVPYSVIPGNHDMPRLRGSDVHEDSVLSRNLDTFNFHFPTSRFQKPWTGFGGEMPGAPENRYWFFEHERHRFMVLGLEMAPRKDAVCWANDLARQHGDRRIIVTTHCFLTTDGRLQTNCASRYALVGSAGDVLFDELIKRHSNITLVLSGHINDAEHLDTIGLDPRHRVHAILTDYQNEREANGTGPKSGNGWLRLMTFYPTRDSVHIEARTVKRGVTRFFEDRYDSSPTHHHHTFGFRFDLGPMADVRHAGPLQSFRDRTVNPSSRGQQRDPVVAANTSGAFAVAWTDDRDGNGTTQVHARVFNGDGCERFRVVPVNTVSQGNQRNPTVAIDPAGGMVVVWEDDRDGDGLYEIFARGFRPNGHQRFDQVMVNASSAGQQRNPSVAIDRHGNFVVTWEDDRNRNGVYEIRARRFPADGNLTFPEFKPHTVSAGQQRMPDVAMSPNGDFVIVWADNRDGDSFYDVRARSFRPNGTARGPDFPVARDPFQAAAFLALQPAPRVAVDRRGRFVVAWADDNDRNGSFQIRARGFNSNGGIWFTEQTANTTAGGQQLQPDVAVAPGGEFVVVWSDDRNDNGSYQIRAREFADNGVPRDRELDMTINSDARGQQLSPGVAVMSTSGRYVVDWEDDRNRNDLFEILARGMPRPGSRRD